MAAGRSTATAVRRVSILDFVNNLQKLEESDFATVEAPLKYLRANPVPVHDVRNRREFGERAVSLHLYSRPFDSCIVYSAEQHTCGEIGAALQLDVRQVG